MVQIISQRILIVWQIVFILVNIWYINNKHWYFLVFSEKNSFVKQSFIRQKINEFWKPTSVIHILGKILFSKGIDGFLRYQLSLSIKKF